MAAPAPALVTAGGTAPPPPSEERRSGEAAAGLQWLFASGKVMPGVLLRASDRKVSLDFETSLIWLTEPDMPFGVNLLGSQLGFYLSLRPLHGKRGELAAGLGSDVYSLWNIHGDEWQASASLRVAGHAWLTQTFGLFATARAYPLSTAGVELGVERDRARRLPILFGAGVEWRFR